MYRGIGFIVIFFFVLGVVGIMGVFFIFSVFVIMDRVGRRFLIIVGGFGMSFCLIIVVVFIVIF